MAKYTIEIPEELHKYMVEGNWDVEAYIKQVLLDPLIKRFEGEKKSIVLAEKIKEVEDTVKDVKIKAEIKNFETEKADIETEIRQKIADESAVIEETQPVEETPIEEITEPAVEETTTEEITKI